MTHRPGGTGQTLVEFAFVLPIFLLLLCAVIDAGRWVYTQNSLGDATRDAARGVTVATRPADCLPTDARDVCADKIVQDRVVAIGGPVTVTTTCWRFVNGDRTQVDLSTCTGGDYVDVFAEVRPWQVLTPFLSSFLSPHIDASTQAQVKS
jgi:Flp pilus assembly protein TadG